MSFFLCKNRIYSLQNSEHLDIQGVFQTAFYNLNLLQIIRR